MKTPYDAALRVAERALDEVRAAIGIALGELRTVEEAADAMDAAMLCEMAAAAGDRTIVADPFFARARERRGQLAIARQAAAAAVTALRLRVVECYGTRTAIGDAAMRYRIEAERTIAAAEQAALDDLAASRLVQRRRRRQPAVTPPHR